MSTIRKMTKEDIELCGAIHISAFYGKIDKYLEDNHKDVADKMRGLYRFSDYFSRFIDDADKYAYCFMYEDKVVGYLTAIEIPSLMDGNTIFIDSLAVSQDYQQKGIGTSCLNEFIAMFPENCTKRLLTEKKRPAYEFYKKIGFQDIDLRVMESSQIADLIVKLEKKNKELDEEISKLKKIMELMNVKQKKEIEIINKENEENKKKEVKVLNNEEIKKELEKSKEKQKNLENELIEVKKNYNIAKEYNNKMQELTKEASQMIKNSIESRDKMKQQYDEAIKELIDKYEKQIQFMKVIIVEQNEKYEKEIENTKKKNTKKEDKEENNNDKSKKEGENKEKNEKEEEEKNKYLEKLKNDNVMLLNQNSELKHMNEMLLLKMKDLPELNKRFNELFETVKLLKEENDYLKKTMKDTKIMKMLELEQKKEENEEEEEEKENNNINEKEKEEGQKLNDEELKVLESILKDIETGEDKKAEYDVNKLHILENIIKKLENGKEEESKENEDEEEKNNEENNINDEELNLKNKLLLEAMLHSLDDNNNKNEEEELKKPLNDISANEKENNNNKIYNKKILKSSPGSSNKKKIENNEKDINKLNSVKKNLNEDNEEIEDEEENTPNKINKKFNLYKPIKEGILSFNLSKKIYIPMTPKKYDEFLKVFDPKTSVQYNTLEGLFIIPSNKTNQLYYYSSIKNEMNDLFKLSENHSGGCLFIDNSAKDIIVIGGDTSKKAEKFSFETGKHELLKELPDYISDMSCIEIGNKIYSFFGIAKEGKENRKSPILCLDLEKENGEWEYIDFKNEADFQILSGMSCINLNDNELLIIGGIIDNNIPNDKLMYFNLENKKLLKLDKSLPESENKNYVFTQNNQFNIFLDDNMILYSNIDNNNQVHIIDNELHYDLYLAPSEIHNFK